MGADTVVVVVVLLRFTIPLFIPKYPLPAILAALVLDAADQTIFSWVTSDPLPGYQSYDKALDVYYLAIAYIATMRTWRDPVAFQLSRFLYLYRLIGVTLFELTHARWLLLVFPNTFEYFFIAYEAVRTRWNPLAHQRHGAGRARRPSSGSSSSCHRSGGSTSPSSTSPISWTTTRGRGS